MEKDTKVKTGVMSFIVIMGIVSLFSDMTHEGASSILGAFLSLSGASAAAIGFTSGLGELVGYSLRLLTGIVADRSRKYWPLTIIGYIVDCMAIPALALVPNGGWKWACALMVLERTGKAIKKPAKDTLLSFAASQAGAGKSFALQELLDQIGAFLGPVMLFAMLTLKKTDNPLADYSRSFALLLIPALCCIALLLYARHCFPNPENFEPENKTSSTLTLTKPFLLYIAAIGFFAFGFLDFTLITMHTAKGGLVPPDTLPLVYAGAMAVDALAAVIFGWLYDKHGISVLMLSSLTAAPFPLFIFAMHSRWALFLGVALWGVGMGAQESILKAAVTSIVPKNCRSTGFGVFQTAFGACWFLGSWALGAMYDRSVLGMSVISTVIQLAAIPFFYLSAKAMKDSDKDPSSSVQ